MKSIRTAIIGASGHYGQVTDAAKQGLIPLPLGIAPGDRGEDVSGLARALGLKQFDSWQEMLDEIDPQLAVVNSWYGHMAEKTIYCLERGIHVFSEKPLAASFEQLEALEKAYASGCAALGCMLNLNCCGWYKAIEQSIARGDIGKLRLIHAQKSYRMGSRGPQYQNRDDYGGTIPWVGMHAIDWILGLAGRCEQVSAYHTRLDNGGNGDMETCAVISMQLEGEVLASADLDFLRPSGSARHDDDRLRVTGTRGMLEAIDGRVYLENEQSRRELTLPKSENPFERFLEAVENGTSDALARRALYDTRVCLFARESADSKININCTEWRHSNV
ncbi:MAG: Gfo/Idh/MocA family oxidoreductase [Clostridia bacterium]|nr:Gfo/Idh/MocA family oxidoreductase [Clostridia bacterium]